MIPLVEKPHITVRINYFGGIEAVTTNIAPDIQVNICYTQKSFEEVKQGDAYEGGNEVIYTE